MGTYTALPNLYLPSQAGAPLASGINNTVGELITLLDAILVNGYGSVTLSSLVVSGGVATATVSTGHGFVNVGTYGPVVQVAGATPSGLNGNKRITVTSSTAFTFAASGIADGTATGTITAKMAPAGWTKEFSGTNKAVYRPASGLRHYLRVDDTAGTNARARGFVSMSNIDTGEEPFPTDDQVPGGLYVYKSSTTTTRPWVAIADERFLYLFIDASGNETWYGNLVFGEFIRAIPGDAYNTLINSQDSASSTALAWSSFGASSGDAAHYMPRNTAQVGPAQMGSRFQQGHNPNNPGVGGESASPVCGFLRFSDVEVMSSTTALRGWSPGAYCVPFVANIGTVFEVFDGKLAGRTLYTLDQTSYSMQVDITGPWFDD
jgi:hypothetical protein